MKSYQLATLTLLAAVALYTPADAARRKSDKGPHPLKVLKIVQDSNSTTSMNGASGRYHIWMQNTTDVAVDKVQIEMELYNKNGRLEDTVKQDLGTIESGQKKFADMKYNIVGEDTIKPRFWLLYNAGGEKPAQFEIDGPSWNF